MTWGQDQAPGPLTTSLRPWLSLENLCGEAGGAGLLYRILGARQALEAI